MWGNPWKQLQSFPHWIICNFRYFWAQNPFPNKSYSVNKTNFAQIFMNFVRETIIFIIVFGVLFLIPWYGFSQIVTARGRGELPYVGYMGICHRPGSIFRFQKSRTSPEFWTFFPEQALIFKVLLMNRILFWESGLKPEFQTSKFQLLSWKMTGPISIFFLKSYACLLAKNADCVLVTIIISKLYSNKFMLPVRLLFPAAWC